VVNRAIDIVADRERKKRLAAKKGAGGDAVGDAVEGEAAEGEGGDAPAEAQ
jgi:hypothetical protein